MLILGCCHCPSHSFIISFCCKRLQGKAWTYCNWKSSFGVRFWWPEK